MQEWSFRGRRPTGGKALRVLVTALFSSQLSVPRAALADVTSCARLHAEGQREANAGHLKLASEHFAACGSGDSCPSAIRSECVEFYAAVQRQLPTVIFTAVDEHGRDITDVRVYQADQLLVERLDGRPIAVDPGEHAFRFVLPSGAEGTSEVLIREGEKNRVVSVRMSGAARAAGIGSTAGSIEGPLTSAEGATASGSALPPAFWVSTGVGGAALASWGIFALLGNSQQSKVDACAPNCASGTRDNFDAMRRDYLIADISLGLSVVSAGVATWLYIAHQRSKADLVQPSVSSVARLSVQPWGAGSGAGLLVNIEAL